MRTERVLRSEAGVTLVEMSVTSAILLVVVVTAMSALTSGFGTSTYAKERSKSLDDLRTMAAVFGKDARQAVSVATATSSTVKINTYVNGVVKEVTWSAADDRLTRIVAGTPSENRVYLVSLTTTAVFSYYGETDATKVTRVRLAAATKPLGNHPPVEIVSDAEMRNVA